MKQYKFTHASDSSIEYTYRRPTTDEFATYWNANVAAGGKPDIVAQANLTIAVRQTPSEEVFKELINAEWSSFPANVIGILLGEAGLFPIADKVDQDHGERIDIVKLMRDWDKCSNIDDDSATEDDIARVQRLCGAGLNHDKLTSLLGKRNPAATRIVIALPESIGGYYVGRVPSLSDRHNAQRIQNAPSTDDEHGAFDALCKLFLDCCLYCAPLTPQQMTEQWPGAVVAVALAVRDLGTDSFVLEQKKSNP